MTEQKYIDRFDAWWQANVKGTGVDIIAPIKKKMIDDERKMDLIKQALEQVIKTFNECSPQPKVSEEAAKIKLLVDQI